MPNTSGLNREVFNMSTTTCPSRETLLHYSLGLISEEESNYLTDHLDSCPDCQATIMTLDDADDTAIGRLRTPLSSESVLAEPQLQRALAAAMAMPIPRANASGGLDLEGVPAPDMPETLGEYQLLEELGHGGMGRVYKALHTKLDRVVAVKVLSRGRVGDRQAINRFEREVKAVGRLAHPNIVQAYDAREINDMPVLIMEFVDGLDLAEIVRRVGRLPVADACELVRRTALALQCAHEHGLVHRDIKPSNIMLARSGEVKLLDLGLARFYAEDGADVLPVPAGDDMTGTGQAMGTADYMAPEQASDSRTVDIRADLYSLGCTLYKLLSGRAPFSGPEYRSTLDKLNAHVHQPVPPVQQLAPDVPEELSTILDRLLAKDPRDRFATPADVVAALEPSCRGANLADLMVRALEGQGEGGVQGEGSIRSNLRPGAGQGEGRIRSPLLPGEGEGVSAVKSMSRFWKRLAGQLTLLMMVGGIALALGIMIRIHKDGKETAVEVPEGSKARVTADGQLEVTLPGQTAAAGGTDATKPEQSPAAPFIGRLPQGTVELVGIRDYLSDDQTQWWQPNGTVVHLGPFQSRNFHGYVGVGVQQGRDFLVRFKDLPTDACWPAWKLKPSDHWDGSEVKDVFGKIVPDYKMLSALLPASARTADFQIGIGMGQWETVARQRADSGGTSTFSRDGKQWTVTFQQATAGELVDSTRITLNSRMHFEWNARLVAVDSDGKEHALGLAQHSAGDISNAAAVFNGLPLSSVKEFQLQVRPYYWITFRNIALQPGQKTDVQVVLPGRTKSAEGAQNAGASAPAAPPEVTVIRPTVRQVTQYVDFTGQTEAVQTAEVRPRVTGRLAKVLFKPGTMVKQGEVLFEIDPAPFQAEVDKREADVRLAQLRLNRTTAELKDAKAPAPSDRQRLEAQQAEAEAALTAAQEGLKVARLNLASTRLTAPISGKIGRPLVPVGSLVADTKSLAPIDSVDPICVAFAVDERTLLGLRRNPPRFHGEPGLPVLVGLADEKGFPHKAKFESADTRVDPATGTARWRALLPNPDGLLMPGLFVRVRLVTSDPYQALLLPETALNSDQGRKFVWIVTGPNLVQSRNVEIGQLSEDGMRVVNKGLTADDWVVEKASFQHSLPWKAGMTFKPKKAPEAVPPSSPNDKPPAAAPPGAAAAEDRSAAAVCRGLAFLAARQRDDGSYGPEGRGSDLAVTAFVSRAMMASGSTPGKGPYGERLAKGLAYLLGRVQENGLIRSKDPIDGMPMYGHAFALTFLAECQKAAPRNDIKEKIERAVTVIVKSQNEEGGWRYFPKPDDADLSVTAVQLLALAAAR
jgi:RND family efflux transporter MFP subunit